MNKRALVSRLLCRSGLRGLLHRTFAWSGVLALNYHRIGEARESNFDHGLWSASADAFAEQVRFCRKHLDIIEPSDLSQVLSNKKGRHALITFDDGYRDNYASAFPILKNEGVTATFFVATGFIDHPTLPWWDEIAWMVRTSAQDSIELSEWRLPRVAFDEPRREDAVRALLTRYKSLPAESTTTYLDAIGVATGSGRCSPEVGKDFWMDWDMLREMQSAGMTIGGHTVSHQVLARMTPDDQRREIQECGRRLSGELGVPMHYFSYPVGGLSEFDAVTRECLAAAGVTHAFSYYGGYRRFDDWDDYDVRRVAVETDLTPDMFRTTLTLPQVFS